MDTLQLHQQMNDPKRPQKLSVWVYKVGLGALRNLIHASDELADARSTQNEVRAAYSRETINGCRETLWEIVHAFPNAQWTWYLPDAVGGDMLAAEVKAVSGEPNKLISVKYRPLTADERQQLTPLAGSDQK